jgi:hypothetical protein
MLKFLRKNFLLILLVFVSFIFHLLAFIELGSNYTINSDDLSYISSGLSLFNTGKVMIGYETAQIMPGMPLLIAFFCIFFKSYSSLIFSLKIFWMLMGISSSVMLYKTINLYANKGISFLMSLFLLTADFIWMDNIILTETPFMLAFICLIYHSIKFSDTDKTSNYIMIIIWFLIALFMRPVIAVYPLFLFFYLLAKKHKLKPLLMKGVIGFIIVMITLCPWIYRNYVLFGKFIPFTYGVGNPLLLGTYQGEGYPADEDLDYVKNIDDKLPKEMNYYLNGNPQEKLYKVKYYELEYDGLKAKYRMKEWWKKDKKSFIKSYFLIKPKEMIYSSFYWDEIFGISAQDNLNVRKIELFIFLISSLAILINHKKIKEYLFLLSIYIFQIAVYCYTFSYSRYAITLYFLRFIICGIGLQIIYEYLKKFIRKKV